MKLSVITVCYNSMSTIGDAIRSVLNQDYPGIEYIIVDGASNDGTPAVIDIFKKKIAKIISEPDSGIYEAMNKGIKAATGEVIGFLNADDFYSHRGVITRVAGVFAANDTDCCYGDLVYVKNDDKKTVVRYWKSKPYNEGNFRKGWHPPHPTFFAKRNIFNIYGEFDVRLRIAADYELMLRFLYKNKLRSEYIPEVLVRMRIGGLSNRSIGNIIRANLEVYRAWKINNLSVSPFIIIGKPLSKIKQLYHRGV